MIQIRQLITHLIILQSEKYWFRKWDCCDLLRRLSTRMSSEQQNWKFEFKLSERDPWNECKILQIMCMKRYTCGNQDEENKHSIDKQRIAGCRVVIQSLHTSTIRDVQVEILIFMFMATFYEPVESCHMIKWRHTHKLSWLTEFTYLRHPPGAQILFITNNNAKQNYLNLYFFLLISWLSWP